MLYKYRTLQNFKNFVDIILNQRLYAAPYFDMNDPMEGHYRYNSGIVSEDLIKTIKGEKDKLRICSLSRTPSNLLMWSHYADGHHGVVIGVEVAPKHEIRPVNYNGRLNLNAAHLLRYLNNETAKMILTHKHEAWRYEEEERVFLSDGTFFVEAEVKEIVLGTRMCNQDKSLIRSLATQINPNIRVIASKTASI